LSTPRLHSALATTCRSIPPDGRDRQSLPAAPVLDQAVEGLERTVDGDFVPAFGVADVFDREVVVPAPEERHRVEALAPAEHVACGDLPLTLGHYPVLDTNAFAGER